MSGEGEDTGAVSSAQICTENTHAHTPTEIVMNSKAIQSSVHFQLKYVKQNIK